MWHWNDQPGPAGWIWMAVMMFVVWLPLIIAAIWLVRFVGDRPRSPSQPGRDPKEIARERYAQGAIDRERYLQIVEDLEHVGDSAGSRP